MREDNFLINHYKNNNGIKERMEINKKILIKLDILLILGLLFFLMLNFSSVSNFKGEVEVIATIKPFKIIMIVSLILGTIGFVITIINAVRPDQLEEDLRKIPFKVKKALYSIIDWLSIIPTCIVIAIFCFSYLFIITPVSGDSMYPNIKDGEYVLVQYNKKIEREDVVIIEVNKYDSIYEGETNFYIKRIIGLPGDKVRWENNILYINDKPYNEDYFEKGWFGTSLTNPFDGMFKYVDEFGEIQTTDVIPEGYYFVLGDNRAISQDSRGIGLVKEKNVIGVATHHMNYIIPRGEIK